MFTSENSIDWSETKCSICDLKLSPSTKEAMMTKHTTYPHSSDGQKNQKIPAAFEIL